MKAVQPIKTWLSAIAMLLLTVTAASAQQYQPFGPTGIETDLQIFAPADLGEFGARPQPNEGYFFTYDKLNWFLPASPTSTVGMGSVVTINGAIPPATIVHTSGVAVAYPEGSFGWGDRYELGYIVDDEGWAVTALYGLESTAEDSYGIGLSNVVVIFDDPQDLFRDVNGSFVPEFGSLTIRSSTSVDGVELMKLHRLRPFHNGGVVELSYGARYMKIKDMFNVSGTIGTNMGASFWDTRVRNDIVGPQVGGLYVKNNGRWKFSVDGRATAGYNVQSFDQVASINENPANPTELGQNSSNHTARDEQLSVIAELRAEWTYQITRSFALNAGWTGTYTSNIARASTSVDYVFPNMGLRPDGDENYFTNGLNFGVEFNR